MPDNTDNTFPHEPAPRPVSPEPDNAHEVAVVLQEDMRGGSGITNAPAASEPDDAHPVPPAPPLDAMQP